MALLDRSSAAYRVVAGIIASAHRRVGATESQRWNGDIGVLSTVSRQRSRSDLDGTIHLHPRNVIGPLTRAHGGADARWWYPRAARDAAYNVIYEALRQSSKTGREPPSTEPGKSLDSDLAAVTLSLDKALAEQRTYEIAEWVLSDNGMAQVYSEDPPDAAAIGGHSLAGSTVRPFRLTAWSTSTTSTAAARGFVDGVTGASGQGRDELFNRLLTQAKTSRWSRALKEVADQHHPGLLPELPSELRLSIYQEVTRQAVSEWNRASSSRTLTFSTADAAAEWAYAIGRDTADRVVDMSRGLGELEQELSTQPAQEALRAGEAAPPTQPGEEPRAEEAAGRELSPSELFGPQTPFTGVKAPPSTPGVSATPGQPPGAERQKPLEK